MAGIVVVVGTYRKFTERIYRTNSGKLSVQQWRKGQKNIDTGVKSRVLCTRLTFHWDTGKVIITTTTENIRIVVGGGGCCGKG